MNKTFLSLVAPLTAKNLNSVVQKSRKQNQPWLKNKISLTIEQFNPLHRYKNTNIELFTLQKE
jgi:hypothetical protein